MNGAKIDHNDGIIEVETEPTVMTTPSGHKEEIVLDLVPMGSHHVILGIPWFEKHNPRIDWGRRVIELSNCKCQEEKTGTTIVEGPQKLDATKEEPGHQKKSGPHVKQIPHEYREFHKLFTEETDVRALPEHKPWDHEMHLVEGAKPSYEPLRKMSDEDLRTLKAFIDEYLAKGFIRESTSPWGAPVLFVPKPGGKKRMCVDWRKLNAMTKKDRYALPLADELRDRIQGAKIFTQLDLQGAYNLVRIKAREEEKTAF